MKIICVVVILSVMCGLIHGITNEHHQAVVNVIQKAKEFKDPRDPPPEYYRGPSSSSSSSYSSPTSYNRDRYSEKDFITSSGSPWPPSTPPSYNNRDRLGSGTSFGSWSTSNSGKLDDSRYDGSYGTNNNGHYNIGYQTGTNRYGYIPGGTYDQTRPSYGSQIPYDSHGSYNPTSVYGSHGSPQFPDFQISDSGYENWNNAQNGLTRGKEISKKILLPLAGAAILGVAAALVANPVLIHLGVAHGKRKRRDTTFEEAQSLAYKGHNIDE